MSDYDLSPVLKVFTGQTKNVMSNKDIRFKQLFRALDDFGEIRLIKSLLSYLVSATYRASDDDISAIFQGIGQ